MPDHQMKSIARGAIYGALIGDAAGATLEFLSRKPDRDDVKRAMSLIGGGHWRTAPGQITDDGEMMLSLMSALAGKNEFSINSVAESYLKWFNSLPFDIGVTTRNGLEGGFGKPFEMIASSMTKTAARFNNGSKGNGALMRIAPLGLWGHRLNEERLIEIARQDAGLTHPNRTCQDCSVIYSLAIRHLILYPRDNDGAFATAKKWVNLICNDESRSWIDDAEKNIDVGYTPSSGWVKYAFTHAFRHLKLGTSYLNAIMETLMGGGDTDTNACIVGGLIGALSGEQQIPSVMINKLLQCDTKSGRPRPEFLQPRVMLPKLIDELI